MTAFDLLQNVPWHSLVRALLHSLWQGPLVAGALFLLLRKLSAAKANLRYALCLSALGLVFLAASATWRLEQRHTPPAPPPASQPADVAELVAPPPAEDGPAEHALPVAADFRVHLFSWAAAAWAFGASAMLMRLAFSVLGVWRLRMSARPPEDPSPCRMAEEVRAAMGMARRVSLLVHDGLRSPVAVGVFWPTLLLPASLASGIPAGQLRAILAHELAHIRHWDYLVNLLQMVLEAIFFFNPALWWISRQTRIERESRCDAVAAAIAGARSDYAAALLAAGGATGRAAPGAPAFSQGPRPSVLDRFRRILQPSGMPEVRMPWYSLLAVLLLAAALLGGVFFGTQEAVDAAMRGISGGIKSNAAGGHGRIWYFWKPSDGEFLFAFLRTQGSMSLRHRWPVIYSDFWVVWQDMTARVGYNRRAGTLRIGRQSFDLAKGNVFHFHEAAGKMRIEQKNVVLPVKEVRGGDTRAVLYHIEKQCLDLDPPARQPSSVERVEKVATALEKAAIGPEPPTFSEPVPREARLEIAVSADRGARLPEDVFMAYRVQKEERRFSGGAEIRQGRLSQGVPAGEIQIVVETEFTGFAPAFIGPFLVAEGEERRLDITLTSGFEGVVRFIDEEGRSIRGAKVTRGAFRDGDIGSSSINLKDMASDRNGLVRIPRAVEKSFHAWVMAAGYRYEQIAVTPKPGEVVNVVLSKARPAEGIVVSSADGSPVRGARFQRTPGPGRLDSLHTAPPFPGDATPVADRRGRFSIDYLHEGAPYYFTVSADGFGPLHHLRVEAGQRGMRVELPPELYVRGTILGSLSKMDRTPQGRPRFSYYQKDASHISAEAHVRGGIGHFELRGLHRGRLDIHVADRLYRLDLERSLDDFVIDLDAPQWKTRPFVLRLVPPDGEPAPEGTVHIGLFGHAFTGFRTGPSRIRDGEARLDVPIHSKVGWGRSEIPGYFLPLEGNYGILVPEGEGPFVVERPLFPAGLVRGEFLDADGAPADSDATIRTIVIEPPEGIDGRGIGGIVNRHRERDSARFIVTPLPLGGTYRLVGQVLFKPEAKTVAVSQPISLSRENPIQEVLLQFPKGGISAGGKVLMPDGTPAQGVKVYLHCFRMGHDTATTNALGEFAFGDLNPEAEYHIRGGGDRDPDYVRWWVPLELAGPPALIHLKEAKSVRGTVVDDATGQPVPDAHVGGVPLLPGLPQPVSSRSDEQGRFEVRGMDDGPFRLRASKRSSLGEIVAVGECDVTAGQTEPAIIRIKRPE